MTVLAECDVEECPGNSLATESGEKASVEVTEFMLDVVEGRSCGTQTWLPVVALTHGEFQRVTLDQTPIGSFWDWHGSDRRPGILQSINILLELVLYWLFRM